MYTHTASLHIAHALCSCCIKIAVKKRKTLTDGERTKSAWAISLSAAPHSLPWSRHTSFENHLRQNQGLKVISVVLLPFIKTTF